jgi:diguanylate cyclase (GGDEF)-like protein/PAS domain S-box-containing protein
MPTWLRASYLGSMAVATGAYFVLPEPPRYLWTLIGCLSVAAIVAGILGNRPRHALPWWLVAAGTAAFIAGDTTYDVLTGPMGIEDPFPSAADVLYLCTYPLFAAGLLLIVRARSRDRDVPALLDALIITTGLGLLAWVYLASPYVQDATLTNLEKGFSIAYPLGDVLLLAVLARLLIGSGARSQSLLLLTLGSVGLMSSDVMYGYIQLNGLWETGGPVDLGWILFYAAWGAAALTPDMAQLAEPVPLGQQRMSRVRLALLGSASLVPPAILLQGALTDELHDIVVNALASALLFVLVSLRLGGLVGAARQSTERENVLRRTGEALVGATSREEIYAVGAQAIAALMDGGERHRVLVVLDADDGARLVHDTEDDARASRRQSADDDGFAELLRGHTADLKAHRFVFLRSGDADGALREILGPGVPVLMAALLRSDEVAGAVAVAGGGVDRTDIIDAVCAIATQMVLALDSADLTELVLQRKNEAHFRSLIQNTSDMILVVDADLRVIYQTPSVAAILGSEPDQIMGRSVIELISAQDSARAGLMLRRLQLSPPRMTSGPVDPDDEWRLPDARGMLRAFEVTCSNLLDEPSVRGVVLTLHDTTERRALEEELKHLAFHDALTQLPNRALFLDRVQHALSRQQRNGEQLAVMFIDIDDFKEVNDTRGHAEGDALLVTVSERLGRALRAEDTCARLGGDEFAVLVEGLASDDEVIALADKIMDALGEPHGIGDDEHTVKASIGISTSEYGADASELLVQADLAMYAAKDSGKGTHRFYRPSLHDVMQTRMSLARDLRRALDDEQFVLFYQPVLDLDSGRVVGAEALIRWQHPERGLVMPDEFIGVVEEGELAVPVGRWVVETAIAQAAAWQSSARSKLFRMSVNVDPQQLRDPGFVGTVAGALRRHGLPARALVLEITERMLTAQEPQILRAMDQLKALGVGLAVDDFGTGYAALGYLRRFPVTTLKIDRSFVSARDKSADDRALVEAIVRLGETFGLGLVAEGVETPEQCGSLLSLGCQRAQGFLFARGLSAAEATEYITAHSAGDISLARDETYPSLALEA